MKSSFRTQTQETEREDDDKRERTKERDCVTEIEREQRTYGFRDEVGGKKWVVLDGCGRVEGPRGRKE